ncbi:uncharacterized protein STEHIDRAFT_108247 [Stereum hirsutum FP-91666 SS1]|uniref:uncharacterized protein n=1 Tax=Stereum hirsutum (strain FP-91666) TaxID=721885 RepID=UPI000440F9E5|nr:uncharacterized protein STEHIDRAFT_108247 [Stereum hirsutum FP-91666 SS1]EIM89526.1 hypothetical protein STEHIDRAFT_108247 [Stereum hirsutum FP-91666 SS1]
MSAPSHASSRSSSRSNKELGSPTSSHSPSDVERSPPKTRSGLTLRGGKIPNNSARNYMRCINEDCKKPSTKACTARCCAEHCSTELTGLKCSVHKGTQAQPANPDELPSSASARSSTKPKRGKRDGTSTPATKPRGRPAGSKAPRGQGLSYSANLDESWERVHDKSDGYAVSDRSAPINMAQVYSQQEAKKVTVMFWEQNGVPPSITRDYTTPHYPFFHPRDHKDLASAIADNNYWMYYDSSRPGWVRTDAPLRIDGSVLHIRLHTVTDCPGLPSIPLPLFPSTPRKRSVYDADPTEDSPSSASKLSRSSSSSSIADSRVGSLSPSRTPSRSGSAGFVTSSPSPSPARTDLAARLAGMSAVSSADDDHPITTPEPQSRPPSAQSLWSDPMNTTPVRSTARIPTPNAVTGTPLALNKSVPETDHQVHSRRLPSPPIAGSSKSPTKPMSFPYTYVCEMAPAMRKFDSTSGTVQERFTHAFPHCKWVKATWYNHFNVWEKAVKRDKFVEGYERLGRTAEGKWSRMKSDLGIK